MSILQSSHTLDSLSRWPQPACSFHSAQAATLLEFHVSLMIYGSVWYMVQNLHCTVTTDSVLANSKTKNAFLLPVHAMFCHNCPLGVKPASTQRCLVHKKNLERFSTYWYAPFCCVCLGCCAAEFEVPEWLMNYPVLSSKLWLLFTQQVGKCMKSETVLFHLLCYYFYRFLICGYKFLSVCVNILNLSATPEVFFLNPSNT
jgi:hypothetical protein